MEVGREMCNLNKGLFIIYLQNNSQKHSSQAICVRVIVEGDCVRVIVEADCVRVIVEGDCVRVIVGGDCVKVIV